MRSRIFVDTAAYYALTDQHDANHARALAVARRLSQDGADLYTTNAIAIEIHSLLLNRLGSDIAGRVLDRLYVSTTRIIRATEADERRGREIIRQYRDKGFSLVDAISFTVMARLHLRIAWTYDHHFAQLSSASRWRVSGLCLPG